MTAPMRELRPRDSNADRPALIASWLSSLSSHIPLYVSVVNREAVEHDVLGWHPRQLPWRR